ncbi:MAG: ferrous iron transport protein A [Oscillospiraceae bacterium]|nr:ferrous iron transport protein A [Oscillospiraceae bacterium]
MKTLDKLNPGESGTVVSISTIGSLRRRIVDMGITPGAKIVMKKKAPFGDPIEVNIRGYNLIIRNSEAKEVRVAT